VNTLVSDSTPILRSLTEAQHAEYLALVFRILDRISSRLTLSMEPDQLSGVVTMDSFRVLKFSPIQATIQKGITSFPSCPKMPPKQTDKPNKSVVATADSATSSLRSGCLNSAILYFKRYVA